MKYHYEIVINDLPATDTAPYKLYFRGGAKKFITREEAEVARQSILNQTYKNGNTVAEELKNTYQSIDIIELLPKKRSSVSADPEYSNPFKAGDILYGSYGYNMTIPVFYRVIKATKAQIVVQELATYVSSGDSMQGCTMPIIEEFVSSNTYRCKVHKYNGYGVYLDRCYLTLWDGKEKWHDRWD